MLLAESIADERPLSRADWTRALLATEVVFASDVVGSGVDWSTTTDFSDIETIQALRLIQRNLAAVVIRPPRTGVRPGPTTSDSA